MRIILTRHITPQGKSMDATNFRAYFGRYLSLSVYTEITNLRAYGISIGSQHYSNTVLFNHADDPPRRRAGASTQL